MDQSERFAQHRARFRRKAELDRAIKIIELTRRKQRPEDVTPLPPAYVPDTLQDVWDRYLADAEAYWRVTWKKETE
jgi:hypothetical protein